MPRRPGLGSYRDVATLSSETNVVGYGAVGIDVAPRVSPIGFRLQVRDNASAFKGLRGEYDDRTARNDVQITGGVTFRF